MLDGKRIVVTGGARGIGAAVVQAYVGAGARVAILDVREELGEALARELGEACFFARADVCEAADVEAGFARVERLRVLIPHLDLCDVAEAGHMVAGDRNDLFTDAVLDFLASLDPQP